MATLFSDHALFQIEERNILSKDILDCIVHPDKVVRQTMIRFRAMRIFKKDKKRYVLIVIYDKQEHADTSIVTAFISSKIKKYI
ncbi:DUF4258 domain-containing protein [Candidatus Uhrbacteria bacterium]|nr:DUF4258 domain-containing protein [Candidatus Uhrbacteria bacterium]